MKNSNEAIHWFSNIKEKQNCKFIQLNIKKFYPTIFEKALNKGMNLARNNTSVSQDNIWIIKQCRKSPLFYNKEAWKKKRARQLLWGHNGQQSWHRAFRVIWLSIWIQSLLENILEKDQMGLYQGGRLIVVCNINSN